MPSANFALALSLTLWMISPAAVAEEGAADLVARIDKNIAARLAKEGVAPVVLAADGEFVRRVTVDLAGRIPTMYFSNGINWISCCCNAMSTTTAGVSICWKSRGKTGPGINSFAKRCYPKSMRPATPGRSPS